MITAAVLFLIAIFALWTIAQFATEPPPCASCGQPATRELGDSPLCKACFERLEPIYQKLVKLNPTREQLETLLQKEEPWER